MIKFHIRDGMVDSIDPGRITRCSLHSLLERQGGTVDASNAHLTQENLGLAARSRSHNIIIACCKELCMFSNKAMDRIEVIHVGIFVQRVAFRVGVQRRLNGGFF